MSKKPEEAHRDKSKKMLKEEKMIVDLEMAVTKEKFKKNQQNVSKDISKKMLKEENMIVDLELAVKKEKFKKKKKKKPLVGVSF